MTAYRIQRLPWGKHEWEDYPEQYIDDYDEEFDYYSDNLNDFIDAAKFYETGDKEKRRIVDSAGMVVWQVAEPFEGDSLSVNIGDVNHLGYELSRILDHYGIPDDVSTKMCKQWLENYSS